MITAAELAGYFAAHAIWCVSDGSVLIPILALQGYDGDDRRMVRLAADDLPAAVNAGREQLADNPMDADDAALLYDGYVNTADGKLDAIILELRAYFSPGSQASLAVPYTPAATGSFRVHRPKLLQWEECDDFDQAAFLQSFFDGVGKHEQGAKIWNDALDESK
jgi:hypothetical protein